MKSIRFMLNSNCYYAVLFVTCSWPLVVAADQKISFNRDIRPILSDKCYFCHGPDPAERQADLRLDTSDGPVEVIESGELLRRINSNDPDEIMPPPRSKLSLSVSEKRLLKSWIEDGARFEQHWAFQELSDTVQLPAVRNASWPRQPLDRFVLVKLEHEGLQPTVEAAPLRWLRRVTFDLTGLPPKLPELEAFEKAILSDRDAAYEQVVERLLGSDAYGEHMAAAWLDSARYADSYGYQSDKLNTQWPYRDWVVKAFNQNLPYDKFLTWQLAGDLLANPTRDQRMATAFNRLHRLNNEGGAVFEEWRLEGVADRVHTFGTAVLGLTLECARCHDHKYDPISTRDYYSLSAFFNSIDEYGLYDDTVKVPSPTMLLPTQAQTSELQTAQSELAAATTAYQNALASAAARVSEWQKVNSGQALQIPDLVTALDFDQPFNESKSTSYFPTTDNLQKTADLQLATVEQSKVPRLEPARGKRRAVRLDGERGMAIKGVEPVDRWTPFSLVVTLQETSRSPLRSVVAHHTRGTDAGYNGWDLTIENGFVESRMYRVWPGNGMGVRSLKPIPTGQWQQLAATFDGSSTAAGLKLFLNGELLETEILRDRIVKSANGTGNYGGTLVIGQRFRSRGFTGGLIDDVQFYKRALATTELRHLALGEPLQLTPEYFASAIDPICRSAYKELLAAKKTLVMAEESIHEIPIMEEMPQPRPAHILARGEYDAPTSNQTLVMRDTFEAIPPQFPEDVPRNRLGLAQWATHPQHPLTSRVIVNRLWQNFYGAGLVRTPENFGLQGDLPTHLQLLDWLARDLIENGWDIKRFCRNLVLSATYRQDSTVTQQLQALDPENRLLARGPSSRLAAEQIRDLALTASGLLNHKQGGPPVSPYQAGGDLWRESNTMSPPYQQSVGKALYRRSLYSVWKRTAPLPNMMAFDATSREVCTVKRSHTNTPLQALVLLNDVQFVEAARELAGKVIFNHGTDEERIASAFLAFTGRKPDNIEQDLLVRLLNEERVYYSSNRTEASQLVQFGDLEWERDVSEVEAAAMTVVCQVILNLDVTVWKR